MDTEREQILGDLRRRSTPGDAASRAAAYIQRHRLIMAPDALSGHHIGPAVSALDQAGLAAQRYVERNSRPRLPDDHAVRDMLTKETLGLLRQERDHELASAETKSDYEYIDHIGRIYNSKFKNIAKMIALTARYAGELPHDLIHPTTRLCIDSKLSRGQYAAQADRDREVEAAINAITDAPDWETFVDPGLACNARIACSDIASRLPRLHGMKVKHALEYMDEAAPDAATFTDFFCAVIACTWRFNSVMSAQPYKTKYEHASVQQALRIASLRLTDFAMDGDQIRYRARKAPTSLAELRGRGGVAL